MKIPTRLCVAAAAASLLAGCVGPRAISRRAVSYNTAVEQARGEMLLLNVLRSRDRRMMVFTGLTRITGSVRAEGRIGVTGNVDAPERASVGPSYSVTDAPTFDTAVLDSQEFTRGIMTPLSFELLEYFWDQGFVREILLLLTVERIEVACPTGSGGELRELQNDPQDKTFPIFRQVVDAASDSGAWEADEHMTEEIGPPVDGAEAARLPTLIQIANGRLRVSARKDGRFQLLRPVERLRLTARGFDPCAGPWGAPVPESRLVFHDTKRSFETATVEGQERRARLVARSPQSVIFFLGEMARPGREIALRPRGPGQPEQERRLFVVREGSECPAGPVFADYEGERWVVPAGKGDCHPGRSLQSLALAAQLLSLQQSSRDLPAAGTVRIIGQ